MPPTVVYETAEVITHDNEQKFQLIGVCTDAGGLFDKHLFLLAIADTEDATSDTYARLCTIADSSEYKTCRGTAVLAGDEYWRSNNFSVLFTDVDVAAAAKTALNDRVDQLTTDYETYTTQFKDTGTDYNFPTGVTTALAQLVEDYYDAWKVYDTKKRDYDEALADETRAATAFTDAETRMNDLLGWEAEMQRLWDEMNEAHSDFDTFVGESNNIVAAIQTFLTAYTAGASAATKAALVGDITTLTTARSDFMDDIEIAVLKVIAANIGVNNHFTQQGLMGSPTGGLIGDYVTYRDNAQAALTLATSDKLIAETEKDDKYADLTTAYNDVRAVQSDWEPDAWFSFPP